MFNIIVKKKKKVYVFLVVKKHKIIDFLGFKKDNKINLDLLKIQKYINNGCFFSETAHDLIYKNVINKDIFYKKYYEN